MLRTFECIECIGYIGCVEHDARPSVQAGPSPTTTDVATTFPLLFVCCHATRCSWLLPRAVPGCCRVLFLAAARPSVQDQSPHIEDKGKSGQTFFGAVEYIFDHKPMVAIMENSPSTRKHPSGWGNSGCFHDCACRARGSTAIDHSRCGVRAGAHPGPARRNRRGRRRPA